MITSQANCQRKSHRLTIPIQVIINNKTFEVGNWSAHGFQAKDIDFELKIDETVDAMLILPTGGSSILLNVKAILKNNFNNLYGFEIIEISDKNSRVLRHYASLAIDGNYNHIDDLSSDLFMTDVATPIQEPILLTDKESKKVHRSFLAKLGTYLSVGIIFFIALFITFLYNYLIVSQSTGLISGNAHYYNAPRDGLLKSMYVSNNQKVSKGELLFEMDIQSDKKLLQNKEQQYSLLKVQLKNAQDAIASINTTIKQKSKELKSIETKEKDKLLESKKEAYENYKRAKYLYEKHLITNIQFTEIKAQYLQFKEQYNTIILHKNIDTKDALIANQGYIKSLDQKISLQKMIDTIAVEIKVLEDDITELQREIRISTVTAQEDGIVHNIFHKEHSYLKFSDNVLTLETFNQPYILTKLLSADIDKIYLGESCLVYSKRLNKFFNAHVVGIGYSITEGTTTNTVEISQNEIPIKIQFDNPDVKFHLNEYLKIYFLNNSDIAKTMFKILPQNLILL